MNQLTNLLLGLAVLALAGCEGTGGGGVGGVVCGSFVSEGTSGPGGPMALIQDTTHAGLVGCVGDSFYQVNFHTAGTHTITVNSMSADVDPQTYTDNMFMMVTGTCTANGGTLADTCTVATTAANTVIYIQVHDFSAEGAIFTLTP